MTKATISIFLIAACAISMAYDCSNIITKEQQGVLSWLGNITFQVPVSTGESGWLMNMVFSQNFTGVGVWEGFVEYNGTEKWAQIINRGEEDAVLERGTIKSLRFRVNYGLDIPIPEVTSFQFQTIELCV